MIRALHALDRWLMDGLLGQVTYRRRVNVAARLAPYVDTDRRMYRSP